MPSRKLQFQRVKQTIDCRNNRLVSFGLFKRQINWVHFIIFDVVVVVCVIQEFQCIILLLFVRWPIQFKINFTHFSTFRLSFHLELEIISSSSLFFFFFFINSFLLRLCVLHCYGIRYGHIPSVSVDIFFSILFLLILNRLFFYRLTQR